MPANAPLLDIVIPVHDRADWLRLCVQAIETWTANPYHLIVVDNASEETETRSLLAELGKRHTVMRHGRNRSFSDSVNAGARVGRAPTLVILNSDVIVQPGWDTHLLQDVAHPEVGLAGARTAPGGASGLQADPALGQVVEPEYLIFFCVAMRREVFEQVGPLDEETCPGWGGGEDLDYSWRVRDAGYRLVVSDAFVFHGAGQTYATQMEAAEKARLERSTLYRLSRKHGPERLQAASRGVPKVALGCMSHGSQTSVAFVESLLKLKKTGSLGLTPIWSQRNVVHDARQRIVAMALKTDCTHLLFVDDDMVFPPHLLTRLLSHRRGIVGALAYQRGEPHGTCVYNWDDDANGHVSLEGIEGSGLLPVDAIGFGAVLIELDVFRELPSPWFQFTLGEDGMGEDLYFCRQARQAGLQVYCDTDMIIGHQGHPIVVDADYKARYVEQNAAVSAQ